MSKSLDDQEIRAVSVGRAQLEYQQRGCRVGDTVAHPSGPETYIVDAIDGHIAVVRPASPSEGGGESVQQRFLIEELYDPQVARDEEFRVTAERVFKLEP